MHWPKEINKIIFFDYNSTTRRIVIRLYKHEYFVNLELSERLRYIMGFGVKDINLKNPYYWTKGLGNVLYNEASFPIDIRAGLYNIYVYCSIVEKQIIGDALVPLLAKMPVSGTFDSVVHHICQHPIYVPLVRTNIDTIEIAIKDDTNNGISLQYGKVILTLHFRKRPTFL